jgi:hypothetical protein
MRFCTYFDGRYAPRALVMLRSLAEVLPSAEVSALVLDARAAALEAHAPPGTRFVPLPALGAEGALAAAWAAGTPRRGGLMALKPSWLAFALAAVPPGESLTYVDADMVFLASPEEAVAEAASTSVTLSPQRFTNPRGDAFWGRFNAGWIGLRHDAHARAFLDAWRRDCDGRMSPSYSNQKFLDQIPVESPRVGVLSHPGVNVAHWNVEGVALGEHGGRVFADGRPLVAYHMAGLFALGFGRCATGLPGHVLDGVLRQRVYEPYLRRLRLAARDLGVRPQEALDRVDWPQRLGDRVRRRLALWRGWAGGGAVRL